MSQQGIKYEAFPFRDSFAARYWDGSSGVKVKTVNVGAELMEILRGTIDPPKVKLELVLSDAPDVVEKTIDFMVLRSTRIRYERVAFELTSSSIFARKTCTGIYSQNEFPGLLFSLQ